MNMGLLTPTPPITEAKIWLDDKSKVCGNTNGH
jgi:hypothetical protein